MGKKNREMRLQNEWLKNYSGESTGIIISLVGELAKHKCEIPEPLKVRIQRLKAATDLWNEIQRNKDVFVP